MNLPANLPVTVTSASAARAERPAEKDAAGMKFDDILLPKKAKDSLGSRQDQGDKQPTTWSWTQLDLSKNKVGWQVEEDPTKIGDAADTEMDESAMAGSEDLASDVANGDDQNPRLHTDPKTGLDKELADTLQDTSGENDLGASEIAPTDPAEEADEDAVQLAAERAAAIDLQSRRPVQGDGEARQGASMVAGEDRRAEARAASRDTAASLGERAPNTGDRAEPGLRDSTRPAPAIGNAERLERHSQRLNAEGEARQAEGRNAAPLRTGLTAREDLLRNDPFVQRVTVVSSQTAPVAPPAQAPASLGLSSVSVQVTAAIREDVEQVSRAVAAQMEAQDSAGSRNRPVHTLQIQLQPADLGRVNARMSIDGSQLRVELQVETEQARAALAKDADSILKSLKAAGFDIDRVTIQQVQPTSNTNQTGTHERGTNAFASQGNGADESGDQGRQRGTGNGEGYASQEGHDGAPQNDPRGGLFI